jgi:serine/threonine protein kinase
MPVGIGAKGGASELDAQINIAKMTQTEATEALRVIRTHLAQPGRESGVLTLVNRTSDGREMKLERQSNFQLWFADEPDRLHDTCQAMKALLTNAGLQDAAGDLENYLDGQGGYHNRIEARKMLEILSDHLPPLEKGCASPDEVFDNAKIDTVKELGRGANGTAFLATMDGRDCVVKKFDDAQPLSLKRGSTPNEAMASYLTSKKHPDYSNDVNVAQPAFYLVSVGDEPNREYQMVNPHTMRSLVKTATKSDYEVMCHGLIMPRASGQEVEALLDGGQLDEAEKKQIVRGTLQSIKGLNARGFVHRDLKPANTFFDKTSGKTTLVDTGSLFKANRTARYIEGSTFGDFRYMHPRSLEGKRHGTEADLWALGMMALEADHPLAHKRLASAMTTQNFNGGVSLEWLRDKLAKEIESFQVDEADDQSLATKDDLLALRDDIENQQKLSRFAMTCFDYATLPSSFWQKTENAQRLYANLQDHPCFSE